MARSFNTLAILFPVFFISVVEAGWNVSDYIQTRKTSFTNSPTIPAPENSLTQGEIDFVYRQLSLNMDFISDGIRVIKMPSNFKSKYVNTNSLGFRAREFTRKTDGVRRIIMLGDSGLFGWNAPSDQDTVSAHLEQILNTKSPIRQRYEVINLGVPSGVSTFHYPTFATYGQELEPDMLILFLGLNDLSGSNIVMPLSFSRRLKRYLSNHTAFQQVGHLARETIATLDQLARRLKSYNAIVPKHKSFVGDRVQPANRTAEDFDLYSGVYLENLEKIYKLASKLGIDVVTVEQPSVRLALKLADKLSPADLQRRNYYQSETLWAWDMGANRYSSVVVRGDAIAKKYGYRHFGVEDIFGAHNGAILQGPYSGLPKESLFVTDAHYTSRGSRLIADAIFAKIRSRAVLSSPQRAK